MIISPAEHVGLVYKYAQIAADKYGGDRGEWVGVCYEAMHEAARLFDGSRGSKFSPFCWQKMMWACLDEYRVRTQSRCYRREGDEKPKRQPPPIIAMPEGATITDTRRLKQQRADRQCIDLDGLLLALTPREREIATMLLRGMNGKQIGDELGITKSRVGQIRDDIRRKAAIRLRLEVA